MVMTWWVFSFGYHFSIANHRIRTFELVSAYVAQDLRIALQFHTNGFSGIEMSA